VGKAVTRRAVRIERPSAGAERVPVVRLLAIAAGCFLLGIGAVVLNAGGKRIVVRAPAAAPPTESAMAESEGVEETAQETAQEAAQETDQHARAAAEEASAPPAFVIAEGDAGVLAPPEAVDAGVEVPTATPFAGARRVEPGRIAYLRCEGVPQRPGPYPCPRDEALEAAVWAVLDTLPRCADAPAGLGESDVRLELITGAPTDAKLRAPRPGVPRLDGPAILRCTAGPLSHLATTTGATKLVLSFRFALVDASQPRTR